VARNRILAVVIMAVLMVTAVGACASSSGSKSSPEAVRKALKATADQSGLRLTLSLKGDPTAFATSSDSGLTADQETAILASTLTLTVHTADGKPLSKAGTGGQLAVVLAYSSSGSNSTTLAELRLVDSTLYAKVDIPELTKVYHLDSTKVGQFRSQLERLGSQVHGISALDSGQWVSLDIQLLNQFTRAAGVTLPSAPQLVANVVATFFNTLALSKDISSTSNDQAQLTVNVQQLVTALARAVALTPGTSSVRKQANSLAQRAHDAVPPDKSAKVIVTVGESIVSNLALSLNQFDTKNTLKKSVNASLDVAKAGSVSAPPGATAIDLSGLLHAFEGTPASS
jgi:hypothetical protein